MLLFIGFLACIIEHFTALLSSDLAPIQHSQSPVPPCPGQSFHWILGAPYHTYPFTIHDTSNRHPPPYNIL
ncbi:hypothetical protein BDQ17DRAFT_1479013 [Cyathus striatus]|nr:hypothetical protein BDQ17DRAFT_1479013 [Cyathus striatus]